MTKTETQCGCCGTVVKRGNDKKGATFAALVSFALYGACALTAATLFVDGLPPLSKCIPACIILLMIRGTADQMCDTGK